MQASTAAGFSTIPVPRYLAFQLAWFTGAALIALTGFRRSTRSTLPVTKQSPEAVPGSGAPSLPAPRAISAPSAAATDTQAP
jgi:hypothetical protein